MAQLAGYGAIGPRVRVLLALLGVPGLAVLIDTVLPRSWPSTVQTDIRVLAFGLTSLVLLGLFVPQRGFKTRKTLRGRVDGVTAFVVILAVIVMLPSASRETWVVLAGVAVEEIVFRRQLPRTLRVLLEVCARPIYAYPAAVLLGQLAFAACHFVVRGHPASLEAGIRLFAAGNFLAIVYEIAGLPAAILLHFAANQLIRTGVIGTFLPPSRATVLASASVSIAGVIVMSLLREYGHVCRDRKGYSATTVPSVANAAASLHSTNS